MLMTALQRIRGPLLILPLALLFIGPPVSSAARPNQGCTGGQISAVDQYCETIPAATGGHATHAGSPTLASTLGPGLVRRIGGGPFRGLLSLPAAGRNGQGNGRVTSPGRGVARDTSQASVSSLPVPLIAILAALAILLAGLAALRRRRGNRPA